MQQTEKKFIKDREKENMYKEYKMLTVESIIEEDYISTS